MIANRRGHIVAMGSLLGKTTMPLTTLYSASKHGVTGLMDGLSADLHFFELDYIKTTTVYPFFVGTRKDLVNTVQGFGLKIPFITPDELAEQIINAVRKDVRNLYYPSFFKMILLEK